MAKDQLSRLTASEFVAESLRREILRGDLLPGQPLLQDHIASRFGVSQSSVREALRRLETLALVSSIRNRGTFVSGLSIAQVEEIYDIRLELELLALRIKFDSITEAELSEAEQLLDVMEGSDEVAFAGDLHKRFHAIFFDTPERTFTRDILGTLYGNLTRVWMGLVKSRPSFARRYENDSQQEHRRLLEAVRDRDLPRAEAILKRHVEEARAKLLHHIGATGGSAGQESRH